MVKVGYCSDIRYSEKCDEKIQRNTALRQLLLRRGHIGKMALLILGNAGSVYNSNQILLT